MHIEPMLHPGCSLLLEQRVTRDEVLGALASRAAEHASGVSSESLLAALIDRESKFPTGTPEGVAFPHALLPEISGTFVIPALVRCGVEWSKQQHPVQDIAFAIFGNSEAPWEHVRLLARLARIVRRSGALENLRGAGDGDDLLARLIEEDRLHG